MYVVLLSCILILQSFQHVEPWPASNSTSITREEGEDVVFMFNAISKIHQAVLGKGNDTSDRYVYLISADDSLGVRINPLLSSPCYAEKFSFVGNLLKGQAWFKIANLDYNDNEQYVIYVFEAPPARLFHRIIIYLTVRKRATAISLVTPTTESISAASRPSPSSPKSQPSSAFKWTSITTAYVTVIIFLILALVVLLIYVWRLRSNNTGKRTNNRRSPSPQENDLEAHMYENVHPMENIPEVIPTQAPRTPDADKEIYATINEDKDKDTAAKPVRCPSAGAQGDVPSLPQHYRELQRKAPIPTPMYEPLEQRDFGNHDEIPAQAVQTHTNDCSKVHQEENTSQSVITIPREKFDAGACIIIQLK